MIFGKGQTPLFSELSMSGHKGPDFEVIQKGNKRKWFHENGSRNRDLWVFRDNLLLN